MRDPALLDVAQDYALKYLHDQGAFELGIVLSPSALRSLTASAARSVTVHIDSWLGRRAATYATQIACTRSSGIAVRNALEAISMPGRPRLPNSSSR